MADIDFRFACQKSDLAFAHDAKAFWHEVGAIMTPDGYRMRVEWFSDANDFGDRTNVPHAGVGCFTDEAYPHSRGNAMTAIAGTNLKTNAGTVAAFPALLEEATIDWGYS